MRCRVFTSYRSVALVAGISFGFVSLGAAAEAALVSVKAVALARAPSMNGQVDETWSQAASIAIAYDFTYKRPASEATTVRVAQDPDGLDIAILAEQHAPLSATQTTNGAGVFNDDYIAVALWPEGTRGFAYVFVSNVLGARFQSSSENSAYSPQWESAGIRTERGYSITMHIPFNIIRSRGAADWRMQVIRNVATASSQYEWTHADQQASPYDPVYAGALAIAPAPSGGKPRPSTRLQIYGLEQISSQQSLGGSTARLGADLSVPVTPTASFLATVHPDYSNVEIDQQSIAPNEFPRQFQEFRPFFTQLTQSFNGTSYCATCPLTLYTLAIPTFREGYAAEGTQGPVSFAAFSTDGYGRNDGAEVATYSVSNDRLTASVSAQNVTANVAGIHDDVDALFAGYQNARSHLTLWANAAQEQGTLVADPSKATWTEYGIAYSTPRTQLGVDRLHIGPTFDPVDGYVSNNDLNGWSAFGSEAIPYGESSFIRSISLAASMSAYDHSDGTLNQASQSLTVNAATKALINVFASTGSSYLRLLDGVTPFTQNAVGAAFRSGTATPASITYASGRYYHGTLQAWYDLATFQLQRRTRLSLEVDRTAYAPDNDMLERPAVQWLERAGLDVQLSRYASLDLGARRIIGVYAPTGFAPPSIAAIDAGNVTAAFHLLNLRNELYVIYGRPDTLSTSPVIYVKFIRYIGAPKGT